MSWFVRHKKFGITLAVTVLLVAGWISLSFLDHSDGKEPTWGVSFAKEQAEYLGLDWQEAYRATLDDLGVNAIRLTAYWNSIEREPGVYDFSDLDWMMQEAANRKVRIVLAVGRRLPRWPECHEPARLRGKTHGETEEEVRQLMTATVERYKDVPTLALWQVENEPFLRVFGECPPPEKDVLQREIELVRSLDSRPILVTDSGELGTWRDAASLGNYLGTTMYRVVWNSVVGYWRYDYILPPVFYRIKAWSVGKPMERMIGSELQAEPWAPKGLLHLAEGEYKKSLDAEQLRENIDFARRTGISEHYLWGVEYWYWLKEKGDPSLWDVARELWKEKA